AAGDRHLRLLAPRLAVRGGDVLPDRPRLRPRPAAACLPVDRVGGEPGDARALLPRLRRAVRRGGDLRADALRGPARSGRGLHAGAPRRADRPGRAAGLLLPLARPPDAARGERPLNSAAARRLPPPGTLFAVSIGPTTFMPADGEPRRPCRPAARGQPLVGAGAAAGRHGGRRR